MQKVKTVRILGGLAPDVTALYYERVIRDYPRTVTDGSYPRILSNSVDLKQYQDLFTANRRPVLTDFLSGGLESLVDAGADLALIVANSPHLVFEDLSEPVPIRPISIVNSVAEAADRLKLRKP